MLFVQHVTQGLELVMRSMGIHELVIIQPCSLIVGRRVCCCYVMTTQRCQLVLKSIPILFCSGTPVHIKSACGSLYVEGSNNE